MLSRADDAEQGHDPSVRDARGRTAYAVASSKAVRDAFRRAMAAAPEQWDWAAAGVPSPLTDELEATQQEKQVRAVVRAVVGCAVMWSGAFGVGEDGTGRQG